MYENDGYLWLEETIKVLKAKHFDELDLENLIEELESVGKSNKNKAVSLLEQVMRYFLYLQHWTAERENNQFHWEAEIDSF